MFIKKSLIVSTMLTIIFGLIGSVHAGSCVIKGMDLLTLESKARGNGMRVRCGYLKTPRHARLHSTFRNYILPGNHAKVGCKGRSTKSKKTTIALIPYRYNLQHGWNLTILQVRGSPNPVSINAGTRVIMASPGLGRKFDIYVTKFKLSHPNKSCSNIQQALTDAIGQ